MLKLTKRKKVDEKKAINGIWIEYKKGFKCRIAKAGNKKIKKAWNALKKRYRNWDRLPDDRQRELMLQMYIDNLLLEWDGIGDYNGSPLELNVKNLDLVIEQFSEDDSEDFLQWVLDEANNFDQYLDDDERDPEDTVEGLEAIAGN